MLTLESIYKSFEKDFNLIIEDDKKHDFYVDEKESSSWVDYQDSDMYVLDNNAGWIEDTIYDYCFEIAQSSCNEVIDAIVKQFGVEDTLDIFNDEYKYDFETIDDIKNLNQPEYLVAQILYDIFSNNDAYESESGVCVVEYIIDLYANAVGEYFGLF